MSSYRGTGGRPDKAKAIAAVVLVHAVLALILMSGLNVRMVSSAVERMTTISIKEAPPQQHPQVLRMRPASRAQPPKRSQGAAGQKTEPAPVIEPAEPQLQPLPSPLPAAKAVESSIATHSGATLGSGTGSAGSGTGTVGSGYSDYSRFTPARLVENIPNSEYRQLASTGIPSGLVGVAILVNANGTVSNCRIARSSGDASIDSLVCQLTLRYVRFDPARDPFGRAVAQDITYFPNWRRH